MNKNLKFSLWIVGVFLFALTVGSFIPSKPVGSNQAASASASRPSQALGRYSQSAPRSGAVATAPPVQATGRGAVVATSAAPPSARAAVPPPESIQYSELLELIKAGKVSSLSFENGSSSVLVSQNGKADCKVVIPDDGKAELRALAALHSVKVKVQAQPEPGPNMLAILGVVGTFLLILIIGSQLLRRASPESGIFNIAKSPGRRVDQLGDSVPKVTFDQVAGADEAVKELRRVVTGLVGRDTYAAFDAELPTGILLVGPPGTGKTMLAKATAGECEGGMDILSGSDFVFMLVGVGAGRVRDLFASARKSVAETGMPHVLFIDEIDAIGGKRGGGASSNGGNQEREQTLNQLLVEMDGVQDNRGILVMGATNRLDMLDEALLRPGRFDCHVRVDLPDRRGREAIFAIHCVRKPLAAEVTLAHLADRTYGYSGADIKGACNRAAILAAERWFHETESLRQQGLSEAQIAAQHPRQILLKDFDEGIDFVRHGNAEPGKQAGMTDVQKRNTAIHEAGHACVSQVMPGSDPVVKITILRRARALGYVQQMPDGDRVGLEMSEAMARIVTALAGRAAQVVLLGVKDSGASNDFQQANHMARLMVTRWGMSRLGHIYVGESDGSPMPGMSANGLSCGPALADRIDLEVSRIVEACYALAKSVVTADRERIEKLNAILLEQETILADQWKSFCRDNPSNLKAEDLQFDPSAPESTETH
ncbi:MAG: AAA family ATPase [Candidatus Obscuribacterales bacterium]|nr:AAA family ATPase [Candidatus Obscuribacterales bacterium]